MAASGTKGIRAAPLAKGYRVRGLNLYRRRAMAAYLFLSVTLVYFASFYFLPMGIELWASLRNRQPLVGQSSFVGIGNYLRALSNTRAVHSFVITLEFGLGITIFGVIIGLGLALALNQRFRGRGILRSVIYFPYMTTFVVVALMWMNILDPTIGILNGLLHLLGLTPQAWLSSTWGALLTIIGITLWHGSGYNMVLFLAGLQGIPEEFHEAAQIDGAGAWARFRHITLPLLAPTTLFVSVVGMIGALQAFAQPYIITHGGPADATRLFAFHIFNEVFSLNNIGYGSALAFMMFLVILVLTLVQFRVGGQEVHY